MASFPALIAGEMNLYRNVSFYIATKGKDGETPLFDGHGSERTVTNSSQTVTGTLTLDGFGNQVASTGSSSNPYMYAATSRYRNDGDAGLTHVGARYYDGQVGRFISRDTELDEHSYLYCDHDPVNYTDADGHQKTKKTGKKSKNGKVTYPKGWPPKLPIKVGKRKVINKIEGDIHTPIGGGSVSHQTESGGQTTQNFDGPTIWRGLTPQQRKSMPTYEKFLDYVQKKEGGK